MARGALLDSPGYVEFSHDGSWGHKREILSGSRANPTFSEIPVVDLSGAFSEDFTTRLKVAKTIAHACENVGFFYIKNHGISEQLMDDTLSAAKGYFGKDLDTKMREHIYNSKDLRGYEPVNGANVDPRTKGGECINTRVKLINTQLTG